MPKPYPKEFREDVVGVARSRPMDTTLKQIAADFGISDSCLADWLAVADAEKDDVPARAARRSPSCERPSAGSGCSIRRTRSFRAAAYRPGEPAPKMMSRSSLNWPLTGFPSR